MGDAPGSTTGQSDSRADSSAETNPTDSAPESPAESGRKRSREERRKELVEAAMRAIRRGDRPLSMNDLAAEAGITKPILYRHFGDREGLVNAISLELLKTLVGMPEGRLRALTKSADESILEAVLEKSTDESLASLHDFLRAFVRAFFRGAQREPEVFRFVMREDGFRTLNAELNPDSTPGSQLGHTISRLLHSAVTARGKDPRIAQVLGQAVASAVEGSVQWWSAAHRDDQDYMADVLGDFLWSGIEAALE